MSSECTNSAPNWRPLPVLLVLLSLFALVLTRPAPRPAKGAVAPPPVQFTWVELRRWLFYCYASFCYQGLSDWTCFWCLNQNVTGQYPREKVAVPPAKVRAVVESDGLYGTYGYVGLTNESIIASFRGTSSIENIIRDIEAWLVPYQGGPPGASVHRGFYKSYLDVRAKVRAAVSELHERHPSLPITVTGHSLGGAISMLAALDLAELNASWPVRLLNFGQPRVGNPAFAAYFATKVTYSYRVVNQRDIVPHFPLPQMGYQHPMTELWFPNNGYNWTTCLQGGEDPVCSDQLWPWQWRPSDHTLYLDISQGIQNAHGCGKPPLPLP